ncbi:uncharacterized protein K452DRAFT_10333 [Aplosporella prunicola CBS 121167]|uniref:Uncharacterized protein n=1 Tax=Aplosporella prunicola CBS 121167 TaxID=1176127 RepID=A0A6A6BHN3_9PEZI|nr:uncharacterized protein K452DRAFT_10333 [Aplosporella prunicola CBS 121167]KAF2142754.1 hypothetical protein K452DRAFT_10333 [Aplosporella prunicola CBS 121167]
MASSSRVISIQQQVLKLFSRRAFALSLPVAAGSIVLFLQWRKRRSLRGKGKPKHPRSKEIEAKEQQPSTVEPEKPVAAAEPTETAPVESSEPVVETPPSPVVVHMEVAPAEPAVEVPGEIVIDAPAQDPLEISAKFPVIASTEVDVETAVEPAVEPTADVAEQVASDSAEIPAEVSAETPAAGTVEVPTAPASELPTEEALEPPVTFTQPPSYRDHIATVPQSRRVPPTHIRPNVDFTQPLRPIHNRKRSREDSLTSPVVERLPGMGIPNKKRDVESSSPASTPAPEVEVEVATAPLSHLPGMGMPNSVPRAAAAAPSRIPAPSSIPTSSSNTTTAAPSQPRTSIPVPASAAPVSVTVTAPAPAQPKLTRVERPRLGRGRSVEKVQSYAGLSNLPGAGAGPREGPPRGLAPLQTIPDHAPLPPPSPRATDRPRPTRGRFSEDSYRTRSSIPQPASATAGGAAAQGQTGSPYVSSPLAHLPGMGRPNSVSDAPEERAEVKTPTSRIAGPRRRSSAAAHGATPARKGSVSGEDIFTSPSTSPDSKRFVEKLRGSN